MDRVREVADGIWSIHVHDPLLARLDGRDLNSNPPHPISVTYYTRNKVYPMSPAHLVARDYRCRGRVRSVCNFARM